MLLVLDIGNTNTVIGAFDEDQLVYNWRIKTDRYKTRDEFAMLLKSLFNYNDIQFKQVKGIIISSVVPPIMLALEEMCDTYFQIKPLIVGRENVHPFIKIAYPHPQEIGADRIVNAVSAIEIYGGDKPLLIIDFGTATTYCYINNHNEYVGGIISPGIKISMEALYDKASKLPKIEIQPPKTIIGSSTVEAMQSGVFYGYLEQVDGIIKRIEEEMQIKPQVIATGGLASLMAKESKKIDIVDLNLTLKGLSIIYRKNISL